tara:strand:+ start:279 stop:494 length:216 start_codon:yes stop_codon:yes gene_type:complete
MGTHSSSVHPGKTVDSYITKSPFFKIDEIDFEADIKCDKSGSRFLFIGVGTVIIYLLAMAISFSVDVRYNP